MLMEDFIIAANLWVMKQGMQRPLAEQLGAYLDIVPKETRYVNPDTPP